MTRPSSPSMIAIRQCWARSRNLPSPTTAGISSAAATIAVWLARPPASVAKPGTRRGSSPAASLGVRSCASTIVGAASSSWNDSGRSPIKWLRIRASMSRTSAARAARCEPESRSSREA